MEYVNENLGKIDRKDKESIIHDDDTGIELDTIDKSEQSKQNKPGDDHDDAHQYEHLSIYDTISDRSKAPQDRNRVTPLEIKKGDDPKKERDINDRMNALHNQVMKQNRKIRILVVILSIVILACAILVMILVVAPEVKDGGWSNWGDFDECRGSKYYGIGLKSRTRQCDNPKPSKNGKLCPGNSLEVALCNE